MTKEERPRAFKRGRGRPEKIDADIQAKICRTIRSGAYIETAAAYAGITKETFYKWLKRGKKDSSGPYREFSDAVGKALAEAELRDILRIDKAAESQWTAAAWRLERRFPERWARREKIEADLTGSVGAVVGFGELQRGQLAALLKQPELALAAAKLAEALDGGKHPA